MYEKLWLAGLGAYGRYEKLGQEGKKLFEDLVEEGDDMRDELSDRFESAKQKTLDKLNDTIIKVRGTILPETAEDKKAAELVPQLEELTKAVKLLTEVQTGPLADEPKIEVKAADKATKATPASKRKPSASASA